MPSTEWISVQRRVPRRGERVIIRTPSGRTYEATLAVEHLENWPEGASWSTPMLNYNLPLYAVVAWRAAAPTRQAERPSGAQAPRRTALPAICVEVTQEAAFTRMALKALPTRALQARLGAGALTLGELAAEVVALIGRMATILTTEAFDVTASERPAPVEAQEELMRRFAQHWDRLIKAAATTGAEALRAEWTLLRDGAVVFERPRGDVLRLLGLSPLVHYRGQLVQAMRVAEVEVKPFYAPWELPSITPPLPEEDGEA